MIRRLAFVLLLVAGLAQAQGQQAVGDYQVYYSAFPSGFLTQEVARDYGILRSRTRGVLLVSVKRAGQPVAARIEAQIGPGGRSLQPLELRPVQTDGVISYIGSFAIADGESRQFQLRITPADGEPLNIAFSQQFFDGR
ncbi:MAG TPA: DUF4426 domain-containing protein [Gammaproteobacteria bacterium]|nr:DUF4426 domain-containing protein [Gammaproteobacteria bacterium]